jgi:hypothetical protein
MRSHVLTYGMQLTVILPRNLEAEVLSDSVCCSFTDQRGFRLLHPQRSEHNLLTDATIILQNILYESRFPDAFLEGSFDISK